jgi:enoyl-CoA hydratase/carnithine racemase
MFSSDFAAIGGDRIAKCRKPTIAAVSGYALGGGCGLAMMCDIIIASDTAKFGQPEITLGTIPGIGHATTDARDRQVKAMDLCLTGRMMDAARPSVPGLVSRVVPADKLMEEALSAAEKIASMSRPAAAMAKEAINRAFETPLSEGTECRAQSIPLDLRPGRSRRRHGCLHREAQAGEQEQVGPRFRHCDRCSVGWASALAPCPPSMPAMTLMVGTLR